MNALFCSAAFVLLSTGLLPEKNVAVDHVDLIEVNHFYDENGKHVFDQVIFYDWCSQENRHQVRAWRLVKSASQKPTRDWQGEGYETVWHDGDVLRHVTSKLHRESWTQYDPELLERNALPKDQRAELVKPGATYGD
jgi:hypothetical protein